MAMIVRTTLSITLRRRAATPAIILLKAGRRIFLALLAALFVCAAGSVKAMPDATPAEPAARESAVIQRLPNGDLRLGEITVHRQQRQLSFPAAINMNSGLLEVLIATPLGRLHESLLVTDASPLHLQTLLYLIGLQNGPRFPDANGKQGAIVDIDLEWQVHSGEKVVEPIESWIIDNRTDMPMTRYGWVFTGSSVDNGVVLAETNGNLAVLYTTSDTILDIPDKSGDLDTYFHGNENKTHPGLKAAVRVIITPRTTQ